MNADMDYHCNRMPPTGDRGQRYEVRYLDSYEVERVLGWATTAEAAQHLADAIDLHPAWHAPRVVDRGEKA